MAALAAGAIPGAALRRRTTSGSRWPSVVSQPAHRRQRRVQRPRRELDQLAEVAPVRGGDGQRALGAGDEIAELRGVAPEAADGARRRGDEPAQVVAVAAAQRLHPPADRPQRRPRRLDRAPDPVRVGQRLAQAAQHRPLRVGRVALVDRQQVVELDLARRAAGRDRGVAQLRRRRRPRLQVDEHVAAQHGAPADVRPGVAADHHVVVGEPHLDRRGARRAAALDGLDLAHADARDAHRRAGLDLVGRRELGAHEPAGVAPDERDLVRDRHQQDEQDQPDDDGSRAGAVVRAVAAQELEAPAERLAQGHRACSSGAWQGPG